MMDHPGNVSEMCVDTSAGFTSLLPNRERMCDLQGELYYSGCGHHNELWWPNAGNNLSVTSSMLWYLATMKCGGLRWQIVSLTSEMLWYLACA